MVGEKGLEPSPLARPVPKTGVSAIPPLAHKLSSFIYDWKNLSNANNYEYIEY